MKAQKRKRSVLVLGSDRTRAFARTLSEMSLAPTFVKSLEGLVHALRHMQAAAVLVDRDQKRADDLELVLNVRDLNARIPIILIGSTRDRGADEILSSQPDTFLVRKSVNSGSLAQDLKGLTKRTGVFDA